MTENGSSVLGRAARVLLACGLLSLGASGLWAQSMAGKVQGTVLDPTGQPITNAQVFVLGTSFAALTNQDGFYFINNVPSGVYSMRAQFIGYQPAQMEGIRILADQTLTADFRLSGAIALEAITITAAEQPLVPRDQVASKSIITGEDVDRLPVSDAFDVVRLQPGVVTARGGNVSIRGSRANEAAVFIEGAPVRRMDNNTTQLSVATNMMAEASVTTGAMDAAFGDAQAGVISFVMATGGPEFVGTLAYETDQGLGKRTTTGYNRFEGALSGPIFGNLTFSVGGTLTGQLAAVTRSTEEDYPTYTFYGIDTTVAYGGEFGNDSSFVFLPRIAAYGGMCEPTDLNGNGTIDPNTPEDNYGVECQGRIQPYGWGTNLRANAKLNYTYGSGSRASFSWLTDYAQGYGANTMNFEVGNGNTARSSMYVLNWVQQVFRGAQSELAFDLNLSYQTDQTLASTVLRDQDLDLRSPTMGIVLKPLEFMNTFERWAPGDPADNLTRDATGGYVITQLKTDEDWDALIENIRYNRGTIRPYLNRLEIGGRSIPRANAYGITGGFGNLGTGTGGTWLKEKRYVGRAVVDWQADRYNRFKFGAEGTKAAFKRFSGTNITLTSFGNFYVGDPYKWGVFAQDRLDLGDVVIEVGARYDEYDTQTIFPIAPSRLFTNPAFDPTKTVEEMTCQASSPDDPLCDPAIHVWHKSAKHTAFAPRVRVSFPVTDRTNFRLSYAHQTQVPDFFNMYAGTNNDLSNTNTNQTFGGDANFGRTILFEFGIRHAFSEDMILDIAAYNKDKTSDIAYRILPVWDPFADRIANINLLTNQDFGNTRGVDVQWIQRFGNLGQGQVSYTYQNAQSTGSDPTDYLNNLSRIGFNVNGERPEAPQYTLRTRDDRRHTFQGSYSVTLPREWGSLTGGWGFYGTFQLRSGLPYTLVKNNAVGQTSYGGFGLGATPAEPLQNSETPWEKYFDLRVTKDFRLGPVDWTVYADVRNLFNFTNQTGVYIETGDVVNEKLFEEGTLKPQMDRMRNDAQSSNAWTPITKDLGLATERTVGAIDLTDLSTTCPDWVGAGYAAACVMLQRTERRFGNGDGYYDVEEQETALKAYYDWNNGAPYAFYGQGRIVRLGVQLTF